MSIPPIIWHKIISYLPNPNNLMLVNKYFKQLLGDDNFWRYKIFFVYPNYIQLKPDNLSYAQWYKRLSQAGHLYGTDENYKNPQLLMPNLTQYKNCFGRQYYIDIFGQLLYNEKDVMKMCEYGEYYPADGEGYDGQVYTNLGTRLKNNGSVVDQDPIKIMDDVAMVHPTNIGDFLC